MATSAALHAELLSIRSCACGLAAVSALPHLPSKGQRRNYAPLSNICPESSQRLYQSLRQGNVRGRVVFPLVRAALSEERKTAAPKEEAEEVTKKWGLEAGLFKAVTSKSDGKKSSAEVAGELLKQYGGAYLLTSITLAIISFSLCYVAVDNGVDVPALLVKFGLDAGEREEAVGTLALAYAAHKAASPIRFPPTVALTPLVAKWIGRKGGQGDEKNGGDGSA